MEKIDDQDVWANSNGLLYILTEDISLQIYICVAVHCALGGYRIATATMSSIREKVPRLTMKSDVDTFCQELFLCIIS